MTQRCEHPGCRGTMYHDGDELKCLACSRTPRSTVSGSVMPVEPKKEPKAKRVFGNKIDERAFLLDVAELGSIGAMKKWGVSAARRSVIQHDWKIPDLRRFVGNPELRKECILKILADTPPKAEETGSLTLAAAAHQRAEQAPKSRRITINPEELTRRLKVVAQEGRYQGYREAVKDILKGRVELPVPVIQVVDIDTELADVLGSKDRETTAEKTPKGTRT